MVGSVLGFFMDISWASYANRVSAVDELVRLEFFEDKGKRRT